MPCRGDTAATRMAYPQKGVRPTLSLSCLRNPFVNELSSLTMLSNVCARPPSCLYLLALQRGFSVTQSQSKTQCGEVT